METAPGLFETQAPDMCGAGDGHSAAHRIEVPAMTHVAAVPYPWPFDGDFRGDNSALVVIDMQTDFCGKGGYIDLLGYDISVTRACIEPIRRLLAAFRARGFPVYHTREGHRA